MDYNPVYKDCFEAMTHFDQIKAMTAEELAEWKSDPNQLCPPEYRTRGCTYEKTCYECWLDWLKQEVEDK